MGNDGSDETQQDEGTGATPTWSFTVGDLHPAPVVSPRRRPIVLPLPSKEYLAKEEAFAAGEGTAERYFTEDENTTDTVPDIARLLAASTASGDDTSGKVAGVDAKEGADVIGQTVVGRYRIEAPIAVGGMGKVFRVKHLHLNKMFALKQMHANLSTDEKMRARFLQEARLASGLSHANIVSVVDFGQDPDFGAFMVMELVEGETLSRRLRNNDNFPLRMACEVILQIADALHYIHKEGTVHGDIKPDNILLRRAGRSELRRWKVCLLDFGLARPQVSTDNDKDHAEGTPAYMAPELICGEALAEPADIYSLGILAYQLVTGQTPFQGAIRDLMYMHLQDVPKPMSEVLGKPVDEALEALVMKALQKKPEERQSSMAAFLFEMKTLMDMLGFGTRRSQKAIRRSANKSDTSELRLGRMAFEQCGFGIAVVEKDGNVAVGNTAFAHFFRLKPSESLKGVTIMDPRFLRIHPELPADLVQVRSSGNGLRRLLSLNDEQGNVIEMIFNLAPLVGAEEKLILSIVPVG